MAPRRKTPLRKWLDTRSESVGDLAQMLGVSRGRVQHWAIGAVMPRGPLLHHLIQLTGIELEQLLPNLALQQQRREREASRRAKEAINGSALKRGPRAKRR